MKTIAIHQPNFYPWLGYFDKIVRSDVFVILDHVQFPKSDGTWQNRVRLAVNGQPQWVSMPVVRAFEGVRRIDEIRIDDTKPWRRKLQQLLRTNYGKAPAFARVFPVIEAWINHPTDVVADYNVHASTAICERLGLRSPNFVRSSTLPVSGLGSEMLVGIISHLGGSVYLSGDGAGDYMDEAAFTRRGITVKYQRFRQPVYPQRGAREFMPGLSVLDAIFNCGFDGAAQLLEGTTLMESPPS